MRHFIYLFLFTYIFKQAAFGAIDLRVSEQKSFPYLQMISEKVELLENKINESLKHTSVGNINSEFIIEFSNITQTDGLFIRRAKDKKIVLSFSIIHSDDFEQVLAHEVFHAIHDEMRPEEESWIKEGLAQTFEFIIFGKYNSTNVYQSFQNNTYFFSPYTLTEDDRPLYGQHFLYFYYLLNHCGGNKLFWKLASLNSNKMGINGVNEVLKQLNYPNKQCANFNSSFLYFQLSRLINSYTMEDGILKDHFFLISTRSKMSEQNPIDNSFFIHSRPFSVLFTDKRSTVNFSSNEYLHFWIKRTFPYTITNNFEDIDFSKWTQVFIKL